MQVRIRPDDLLRLERPVLALARLRRNSGGGLRVPLSKLTANTTYHFRIVGHHALRRRRQALMETLTTLGRTSNTGETSEGAGNHRSQRRRTARPKGSARARARSRSGPTASRRYGRTRRCRAEAGPTTSTSTPLERRPDLLEDRVQGCELGAAPTRSGGSTKSRGRWLRSPAPHGDLLRSPPTPRCITVTHHGNEQRPTSNR